MIGFLLRGAFGWLTNSAVGQFVMRLGAMALAALLIFHMGERSGRRSAAERAYRDYRDTRRRMDDALVLTDPADARNWLRERAKR